MALYRAQVSIERTPGGRAEDVATNTFLFQSAGVVDIDEDGTASSMTPRTGARNIADRLEALYTSQTGGPAMMMHNSHKVARIAVSNAVEKGSPLHERGLSFNGQLSGQLVPLQVALSVTFRTPIRKRWGRVYLPGVCVATLAQDGRIAQSYCDMLAEAFAVFSDGLDTPTVNVRHVLGSPTPDNPTAPVFQVREYQVDDVPDVIRSRRAEGAPYRARQDSRDSAIL